MSSPAPERVLPGVPAEALVVPPSPKGEPAGERGGWRRGAVRTGDPGPAPGPAPRPPGRRTPTLLRRLDSVPAPLFCLLAMGTVQSGIALSTPLFGPLGVTGTTFLRLVVAAAVLLTATRPRLRDRSPRDLASAGLLGVASAGMTLLFAGAVHRLPMGTAATIEFLGPLAVSLALARRLGHVLWACLAGGGVVLLTAAGGHGAGGGGHAGLDPVGLAFAFGAAACYAGYILLTHRVGAAFRGFEGLAVSIAVGAVVLAPVGLAPAWHGLAADPHPWALLLRVAGVAMLFPVIPYALEMTALRRLPQRVFSVVVSLEPAVSAGVGAVVLGQLVGLPQALGIACVVAASAGATLTGRGAG
ncbi:DMT family transporter [Streptomyces sp. NPDC001380]|uniref:EamA family transporter n=1 Tax=Streptomyces sp. NPDC001380 TaxID=3364566 RepID=UPI003697BC2D